MASQAEIRCATPPSLAERLSLLAVVAAAWATYALATRPALVRPHLLMSYIVILSVSARFRVRRFPALLARLLALALVVCGVVTFVVGVLVALYPVLSAEVLERVLHALAAAFGLLLLLLAFDGALSRPALMLAGGALGLLVVASLLQSGESVVLTITRFLPASAVPLLSFLIASRRTLRGRQDPRTARLVRTALETAFMLCCSVAASLVILRLLPWAQPRVEGAIAGFMEAQPTRATTGMGDSSTLGTIEELASSSRLVLRLWTPEPHNLRRHVATRFDGRTWHAYPTPERTIEPNPRPLPEDVGDWGRRVPGASFWLPGASAGQLTGLNPLTVVQGVLAGQRLPAPANPVVVRAATTGVYLGPTDLLSTPGLTTVEMYGVLSRTGKVAVVPLTDEEQRAYLSISYAPSPRVLELARDLGGVSGPASERVMRTLSYLQRNCQYALAVGKFETSDPIAEFIFTKKRGYCEYFASAAAILLRLQGVPTRYVTGFHVSDLNRSGDHYIVRDSHAHAWLEAFLPGRGWVEIDPTPADQYAAQHPPEARWWGVAWEAVRGELAALSAALRGGDLLGVLGAIALRLLDGATRLLRRPGLWASALLILVLWRWSVRRRQPTRRPSVQLDRGTALPAELREALALLDAVWRRAGVSRPPARGLIEQLDALAGSDATASVKAISRDLAVAYYLAAFGAAPPSADEQRILLDGVRAAVRTPCRTRREGATLAGDT